MAKMRWIVGGILSMISVAAHAGIPTRETMSCPLGGTKFETVGTASCSSFGQMQDFFLKQPTSCDFVTRLPQCPDNKLPLYKEFSKTEIALLRDFVSSDEYLAMRDRSRYYISKKIDDYLIGNGSAPTMNFGYLLGGLQYDRENTQSDAEYRRWFIEAGEKEAQTAEAADAPYIRLLVAYGYYLEGQFDKSNILVAKVKQDASLKDSKLANAYVARLELCNAAQDVAKCPSTDMVLPPEEQE